MEIVNIALQNTKSEYPPQVALPAIITELSQPDSVVQQFGNTLFVIHKTQDGKGMFKALNADTAQKFLQNTVQFLQWAKQSQGMQTMVTDFNDPNILRMIKMIAANPPMPGMGFKAFNLQNGGNRVAVNLGGAQQ